jgi:hypothetical protein
MLLNRPDQRNDAAGHRGVTHRADYLIDRFRVRYEFGGGWACGCADFAATDACRHTREAAGRYIAQTRIAAHLKVGAAHTLTFDGSASGSRDRTPQNEPPEQRRLAELTSSR